MAKACLHDTTMPDAPGAPVYWVARGIPVPHDGMMVNHFPLDRQAFHDRNEAVALRDQLRQVYPDAVVIEERDVDVPGWRELERRQGGATC